MCNEYVKPSREAVIEAMLGSDIITDDLRAEASAQGTTQREPFLCFADAVLDLLHGRSEAEVKAEFDSETDGYTATHHQREVGTGYFYHLAAEGGADRG